MSSPQNISELAQQLQNALQNDNMTVLPEAWLGVPAKAGNTARSRVLFVISSVLNGLLASPAAALAFDDQKFKEVFEAACSVEAKKAAVQKRKMDTRMVSLCGSVWHANTDSS